MKEPVIYKILNVVDGKFYVGSTGNFEGRSRGHRKMLRKGRHHSPYLQAAWNKHGEEAFVFVVVEKVAELSELQAAEDRWLQEHVGKPHCYNTALFSQAPWRGIPKEKHPSFGVPKSEEHRQQISASLKEYYAADPLNHPRTGKRHTPEAIAKIQASLAKSRVGKFERTAETRKRMSEALKGNSCAKGYRRTEAECAAISERMKGTQIWLGKRHSEESKLKMGKPLVAIFPDGTEKQYGTIAMFRQEHGVAPTTIDRALKSGKPLQKGKLKGYSFRYA